ncbi:MAG TPA: hypothetical protein VF762_10655 [Blastocatellia bacterium]|jgi:hypothetical protein
MVMSLLGLILIASLSLGIVAVSLRLHSPARVSYGRGPRESAPLSPARSQWVERSGFARRRDVMVED